jgi:hypothetical protein
MSALLLTTVTLFAATDVRAASQCTTSDYSFKIRFDGVVPANESCAGDIYRYTVLPRSESINKLSLLEFTLERGLSATGHFVCNGVGGQASFNFAKDIPQVCVFTAPLPSEVSSYLTVDICVTGAGGNVDLIGVHTQARDDDNRIKDGTCIVDGPTKGLPAFVSIVKKRVEIRGTDFCIDIDPRTGCPPQDATPRDCVTGDSLPQDPTFTVSSSAAGSHSLKYNQGADGSPACPVGKIVGGSPDCEWITLGGTAYGPICF